MSSNTIDSSKEEVKKQEDDPYMLGRDYVASGRYVKHQSRKDEYRTQQEVNPLIGGHTNKDWQCCTS